MPNIRALFEFVNLGEPYAAWQRFARKHPRCFWPAVYTSADLMQQVGHFDSHPVHSWKTMLMVIWKGDARANYWLRVLLGLGVVALEETFPELRCKRVDDVTLLFQADEPPRRSWDDLRPPSLASVNFDWQRGQFSYKPACEFQEALYWLFQTSWRAKVCPQCGTYFVARKPAQRFCSTDCRDVAQRAIKLRYWREKGNAKRARGRKLKRR
jgi:hypothetical protein